MTYRSIPRSTTGKSAAKLFYGCQPRTLLSALFPKLHTLRQGNTKFICWLKVQIRNFTETSKWIPEIVSQKIGRMMYEIETSPSTIQRHQNQIKKAGSITSLPARDNGD